MCVSATVPPPHVCAINVSTSMNFSLSNSTGHIMYPMNISYVVVFWERAFSPQV